jgi:cytochrome c553
MIHYALRALAAAGAAFLLAGPAFAADAERGRQLAGTCRVCHGLDGVGTNPTVPNIGGQSAQYLVKALQDFREGRRVNEQMTIMAEGLSDEDIADLAAWYASIKATFEMPGG